MPCYSLNEELFSKRYCDKRHSKTFTCIVHRLCLEKEIFTCVCMPMPVYIYEALFSKACSPNLALALQTRFMDWHLSHFGKEPFKYS